MFTEFFCRSGGSNLNGGGRANGAEPPTAAPYSSVNGNWSTSTNVFTPTDGINPSLTVSVGDWASVYVDGATTGVFIGRVTAVANAVNGGITISASARAGTAPTTSATGRSIRVGGAWKGPNVADRFPFTLASIGSLNDASSNKPRINLKNDQTYSMTSAISISSGNVVEGYTTNAGDGGAATIDGGTTGASYVLVDLQTAGTLRDIIIQNNGATGTANGLNVSGGGLCHRVVVHHVRGYGINATSCAGLVECEVYSANQNNTLAGINAASAGMFLVRCISHDNNGAGFVNGAQASFLQCIADMNTGGGFSANSFILAQNCVAWGNTGPGFAVVGGSFPNYFENCIAVNNTTYGLSSTTGVPLTVMNCGFYGNTSGQTNYSAGTSYYESGTVTLSADPFVDAANGNFSLNLQQALNAGRGSFTETAAGYAGTLSYTDLGAAQTSNAGALIPPSEFSFVPSSQTSGAVDPRTLESSYGGGYEQRSGDGLNTTLQSWNLLFTDRNFTELQTIHAFLKSKGGYTAFSWNPPEPMLTTEGQLRVKCKHWDWTYAGGHIVGVSATFIQVAYP